MSETKSPVQVAIAAEREQWTGGVSLPAPQAVQAEPLPHWEPCNPGCDPEFNGKRSRFCGTLCEGARKALAAAPSPDGKAEQAEAPMNETLKTMIADMNGEIEG